MYQWHIYRIENGVAASWIMRRPGDTAGHALVQAAESEAGNKWGALIRPGETYLLLMAGSEHADVAGAGEQQSMAKILTLQESARFTAVPGF
jgi:hypothetical protein